MILSYHLQSITSNFSRNSADKSIQVTLHYMQNCSDPKLFLTSKVGPLVDVESFFILSSKPVWSPQGTDGAKPCQRLWEVGVNRRESHCWQSFQLPGDRVWNVHITIGKWDSTERTGQSLMLYLIKSKQHYSVESHQVTRAYEWGMRLVLCSVCVKETLPYPNLKITLFKWGLTYSISVLPSRVYELLFPCPHIPWCPPIILLYMVVEHPQGDQK